MRKAKELIKELSIGFGAISLSSLGCAGFIAIVLFIIAAMFKFVVIPLFHWVF